MRDGKFIPESLFGSLNESTATLKYWALQQESYEIWEYPSGNIHTIKADRKIDKGGESSMPGDSSWLPIFEVVKTNKELVSELYHDIKANPKMLKRVSSRWLRPWETFFFRRNSLKKFLQ